MSILKLDQTINVLNDVNSTKKSWNVVVRVLRLWCARFHETENPFFTRDGATRSTSKFSIKLRVVTCIYFKCVAFEHVFLMYFFKEYESMHL